MNTYAMEKREELLFPETAPQFLLSCNRVKSELASKASSGPEMKKLCAQTAAELAIDLRSFLVNWKLVPFIKTGAFTLSDIDTQSDAFLDLAGKLGGDSLVTEAKTEIASIKNSSIKKMSEMAMNGEINTVWGHDYASGIDHSLRRGACFATNNPSKCTAFKKDFPDEYRAILSDIVRERPELSLEEKVSMILLKICARGARALRPIFEASNGKYGFQCIQVDPFNIPNADSTEKIISQIEFWNKEFMRELKTETPNIVYKIPAVEKGLPAAETLAGKAYRLCVTLNFTVSQHEYFAKIISEHSPSSFVVLMGGLLDDKVGADLKEQGIENALEIGRHAAQAVIRKSYANLHAKGYDKKAAIMTAAVRGPWAIANTLAPRSGAQSYITTLTNKINEFDQNPTPLVPRMAEAVDPAIMETLMKSKVFRMAYASPKEQAWNWDSLYTFPPFMAFYDQFRASYSEMIEDMKSFR